MRSFTLTIAFITIASIAAACGSDDTNCTQTTGCTEPDGGNSDPCGDGVCNADIGENAVTCDKDCSGVCRPEHPVHCNDSLECNPAGTDCDLPVMPTCGNNVERCPSADVFYNCCDSGPNDADIFWCPKEAPYWCPNTGSCISNQSACAYGTGNRCYDGTRTCAI